MMRTMPLLCWRTALAHSVSAPFAPPLIKFRNGSGDGRVVGGDGGGDGVVVGGGSDGGGDDMVVAATAAT